MAAEEDKLLKEENALVLRVRAICELYAPSAENVAKKEYPEDDEMTTYETNRYLEGRKKALEIAIKLKDEFDRDTALHSVLDLSMTANDVHAAVLIAKAMTVDMIKNVIVEKYPAFFVLNENDGKLRPTEVATLFPRLT